MTRITRVEIITDTGRDYVCWEDDNDITVSYQDDGKTLKVFVNTMKPKSPAEEAYKRVYGAYPMGEPFWIVFEKGYNASQKDYKVGEFQPTPQEPEDNEWKTVALGFGENLSAIGPDGYYDFTPVKWYDWVVDIYENTANEYLKLLQKERAKAKSKEPEKEQQIKELVRESVKWCEEHQNESLEDYLSPRGPQGPVGPGPGPKGVILGYEPTPQTPEFLKFELGKTLEGLIEEWWIDVFTRNSDLSMEESIDCLVTMISSWLPKEQSANSQNVDVEFLVEGFNDAIKKIKSKLRNKKDT